MKRLMITTILVGCMLLVSGNIYAQFLISAAVSQATDVNVTLTKIDSQGTADPSDDVWLGSAQGIDFGDLEMRTFTDPQDSNIKYSVFLPADDSYYAADVGVNGAGPWTINHTVQGADFLSGGDDALGDNVVVTFVKQLDSTTSQQLDQVAIMNANGRTYDSTALSGGWLRVYYGIATGDTSEPSDVTPVAPTQVGRSYSGTVTFTLTTP